MNPPPDAPMLPPTGTEFRVCEDIARRQRTGISKYGTTVADNPLALRQWLQHAYEESLDQAVYLKRAMEEMAVKDTPAVPAQGGREVESVDGSVWIYPPEEPPAAEQGGEVTCNPPLDCDHETLVAYIKGMREGERVTVLGRCCEEGMQGTVTLKEVGVCIKLDPYPSGGQMTVSFLGGARRLTDVFPNVPDAQKPPAADSLRETPRTDAFELANRDSGMNLWVDALNYARTLERELSDEQLEHKETRKDYLALARLLDGHDCAECVMNLRKMIRDLTAAKLDSERMTWLETGSTAMVITNAAGRITRELIDAAMKEVKG